MYLLEPLIIFDLKYNLGEAIIGQLLCQVLGIKEAKTISLHVQKLRDKFRTNTYKELESTKKGFGLVFGCET